MLDLITIIFTIDTGRNPLYNSRKGENMYTYIYDNVNNTLRIYKDGRGIVLTEIGPTMVEFIIALIRQANREG